MIPWTLVAVVERAQAREAAIDDGGILFTDIGPCSVEP